MTPPEPAATSRPTITEAAEIPARELDPFNFEDGTSQSWHSREGKSVVTFASGIAYSGIYSILASDRTEDFEDVIVDVTEFLELGNTYLSEGTPAWGTVIQTAG